jgi:hypothetical protein
LAWEPTAYDVSDSTPGRSIECCDIIPNWKTWEDALSLPLQQLLSAVFLDFDGTNRAMSKKDSAKDSSPSSSK